MGTKAEAEAKLTELPLERAVAVIDFKADAKDCRRFRYPTTGENAFVEIEIDADPSPEQLDALARNLPLPADKRDEAAAKLKGTKAAQAEAAALKAGK